jgi:hypothetical protein
MTRCSVVDADIEAPIEKFKMYKSPHKRPAEMMHSVDETSRYEMWKNLSVGRCGRTMTD